MDLEDKRKSKQLTYQSDINVQYFFWASDSTIVFSNAQSMNDSLRIFGISVETEEMHKLLPTRKAKLRWLNPQKEKSDYLLASMNSRDSTVFDLYRIYLNGAEPVLVTQNPGNISTWFAAPDGKVRLAITSDSVQESMLYRANESEPFRQVAITDYQTLIQPLGYVKNSSTNIYALSNYNRDKLALVEYNTATGREENVLYSNEKVDLDASGYSFHQQELVYSEYTIDKSEKHFFLIKLLKNILISYPVNLRDNLSIL